MSMTNHWKTKTNGFTRQASTVALLLVGSYILIATAQAEAPPLDYWPTEGWKTSPPEAQGLDGNLLNQLVGLIAEGEQYPDLHSLLIVRHGYLVIDELFAGQQADKSHTLQSVSKSFTSAAVGIAIEEGNIENVREPVLGFFPDLEDIQNVDDRKRAMTLEDLLTMRSGTDYHERGPGSPHYQLNETPRGWTKFILDRPMVTEPGTTFQYDSGAVILASAILEARTGQHADTYLESRLFEPLGIEDAWWFRNEDGHPHTGGGLWLKPRDMAKFGLLYLHQGKWEGKQVVPAAWVAASKERHVTFSRSWSNMTGYGYWWWIMAPDPQGDLETEIYAACGFRAQYIFVVPEHDMVVVVTGGTQNGTDQNRPKEFLYSHILPAVVRK